MVKNLPATQETQVGSLGWEDPLQKGVANHASKVMLKILQARLQQYVNCELPDVQAGFRKGIYLLMTTVRARAVLSRDFLKEGAATF